LARATAGPREEQRLISTSLHDHRRSLIPFLSVALALSILLGIAVALPDYLPTNDGPEHVFASYALRHLDDPALGYGRYLKPGATFSQLGFDQLFGLCQRFLGWRGGLRASLVMMSLCWAWGVVAVAAATCRGKRIWLGLMGFAVALQWQLYMGFFSFYLATGVGFYLLALSLWRTEWNLPWRLVLGAGLAAQALVHPVPTICTGATLFFLALWRSSGSRWREVALLTLVGAPAAILALASFDRSGPAPASVFLPLIDRATVALTAFVSGPIWRTVAFPSCASGAFAVGVLGRRWRIEPATGALLTAGLLFATVALTTPQHLGSWQFFSMRFVPLACVCCFVTLPVERWPRWGRRVGLGLLLLFVVASNLWALGYGQRLRRESDDALSGLQAPIRRSGLRLPLIIEPRAGEPQHKPSRTIPYGTANWNLGSLFAVEQGGVPAWTFVESSTIHHLVWRWPEQQGLRAPRPERGFEWALSEPEMLRAPGARKAAVERLLSYAPYYEDVIFYGRPDEVEWLHERHFAIDYQRGGLAIARFQACPATFEFAPGEAGHASTILFFGWYPATEPTFSTTLPAEPDSQTARPWQLRECPCGDIWLRVLFDNDGDGRLSSGDSTCLEGTAQGVLVAHIRPGENRILCHPGRVPK
jgi:hypothetical protein